MARKRKHDTSTSIESEQAAQASRNGAAADPPAAEESSGGGLGKLLFLLILAAILALVLSKDARAKLLDLLFGAEEEFDYSSTTMPVNEPAVGAPAA